MLILSEFKGHSMIAQGLVIFSHNLCTCEHPGYPDDIHLGECLYRLNVSMVHHDQFHQVNNAYYIIHLPLN